MKWALGILVVLTMFACGTQELLPPGWSDGDENNNENRSITDPCAPGATGPDSDSDGRTDECERIMGTDPNSKDTDGDGIEDGFDTLPEADPDNPNNPDPNDPMYQNNLAWWKQALYNSLSNPLLLGSSAMTGSAPPGTSAHVEVQILHVLKDGVGDPKNSETNLSSVRKLCAKGGPNNPESFIYLYFKGEVDQCVGHPEAPGCGPASVTLELCGSFEDSFTDTSANHTFSNFSWHIGRGANRDSYTFDPETLYGSENEVSTEVNFQASDKFNNADIYKNLTTVWTSAWKVSGTIQIPDGTWDHDGDSETDEVPKYKDTPLTAQVEETTKEWKRPASVSEENPENNELKGILGAWTNR